MEVVWSTAYTMSVAGGVDPGIPQMFNPSLEIRVVAAGTRMVAPSKAQMGMHLLVETRSQRWSAAFDAAAREAIAIQPIANDNEG